MNVFETPFAKELTAEDLDCLYCPRGAAKKISLAERFLRAYEIKEKHGLLTETDKKLLPGLRAATKALLRDSCRNNRNSEAIGEMWGILHGSFSCLQPAYWLDKNDQLLRELS